MNDLSIMIEKLFPDVAPKVVPELAKSFKSVSFKKGENILEIGSICNTIYLIAKGAISYFRISNNGVKYNTWFSFEFDIITDLESIVRGTPSRTGILALENCELFALSKINLNRLRKSHHSIETASRRQMEEYLIANDERTFSIQSNSASERYEELVSKYPFIIERVSQTHIASYLGITKETLSRLKKK